MKTLFVKALVFAALAGGTAWLAGATVAPSAGSECGLVLSLPISVGSWSGIPGQPSEAEKDILPPDTEFAKMEYRDSGTPFRISASIVLSGRDRTSIHRPEVCLAGQGWNIRSSRKRTVVLANGESLGVNCLNLTREWIHPNGDSRTVEAFYLYWFVGGRSTTPDNFERILSTAAENVIRGKNPRWAYVGLLSVVPAPLGVSEADSAATLEIMEEWIAKAAPGFQRVFEPVRYF